MLPPPQHPLTLAFRDAGLERRFRRDYFRGSLMAVRSALLLGAFLYGVVFSASDYVNVPHLMRHTLWIRGGVAAAVLGLYAFSFAPAFRRLWQPLLAGLMAVAGAGLVSMLVLDAGGRNFFNGPVLIILPAYILVRLRFVYAAFAGWAVVAAFVVVAVWARSVPEGQFVSTLLFYASANLIGMVGGHALERYARGAFVQARVIDEKRREVGALLETRSRFFANVSHELRTPLTLIAGPVARILDEEPLAPHVRAEMGILQRNADRLLRLVGQLLDLAKLEAGRLSLFAAERDLAAFVRGITASFSSLAEQKGVALRFEAAGPVDVWFDTDKMDKVAVNLIANALKFTPAGGTVEVRVGADRGRAYLDVRDTGAGIPAADVPFIFERFRQAEHAGHVGGTGLGLALTKELVDLHGGRVEVESTPGAGARFRVWLPLGRGHLRPEDLVTEEDAALAPAPPARLAPTTSPLAVAPAGSGEGTPGAMAEAPDDARPLVLVVDDSADMRAFMRSVFGDEFAVEEAADGAEGLERARALVPDLVVTDVMMPHVDGLAFTRALREDAALDHVPVVMLTARAGEESRLEGLRAGVDDYLAKPFSPRELRARVRNLLERQARLRRHFADALERAPLPAFAGQTAPAAPTPARAAGPAVIEATPVDVTPADAAFVARAQAAVEAAIADEAFGVDALADGLCLSRRQLERKMRALTGVSPNDFIRLLRLSRGAQLLAQRYGSVADVSYAIGFGNASYFARLFRARYGVAPSEWPPAGA